MFNSAIPIIVATVISKNLLILFLRSLHIYGWVLQYIFANEKNPFFVFRKYNPKSYTEEEIIDVEVEDEKPRKSLKTF
ncbi:hypothetical protein H2260_04505 [Campylobacter sp. RM10534]|nr:hypothetical protein [Campylobacter sp. RM10534]